MDTLTWTHEHPTKPGWYRIETLDEETLDITTDFQYLNDACEEVLGTPWAWQCPKGNWTPIDIDEMEPQKTVQYLLLPEGD